MSARPVRTPHRPPSAAGGFLAVFPYVLAFAAGFATMAFEMLLGRALVPYFGGTIYTWGALITVFLFGMTVGYFLGGFLSDRTRAFTAMAPLLLVAAILMGATPFLLEPVCLDLLGRYEEVQVGAIVASGLFAFAPAALFASVAPFCLKLRLRALASAGRLAGLLSALNSLGSILGTLGTSFLLIPSFGTRAILFALAVVTAALAAGAWIASRLARHAAPPPAVVVAVVGLLVIALGPLGPGHSVAGPGEQVLESAEWMKARESEWTRRLQPQFRDHLRLVCRRYVRGG